MYDKFYELAAKAGIDIHTKPFSKDQTEYFHGDRAEFLYEFAELIVRECLEACSRANEIRHFVPPTQEQVVLSCMREIKDHFGVES